MPGRWAALSRATPRLVSIGDARWLPVSSYNWVLGGRAPLRGREYRQARGAIPLLGMRGRPISFLAWVPRKGNGPPGGSLWRWRDPIDADEGAAGSLLSEAGNGGHA